MGKVHWKTEEQIKESMKNGISNAQAAFEEGVNNPRRDMLSAALQAIQGGEWEKGIKNGFESWVKNTGTITLEQWKNFATKAASRYADNTAGIGAENWGAYYDAAKTNIETYSNTFLNSKQTKEDRIIFWTNMQKLREIKYTKK